MIGMPKIKLFRFEVCNPSTSYMNGDEKESWFLSLQKKIDTESSIEQKINTFLRDKTLIDINVNTVDVKYHNNGRGNTIHLIYTIAYYEQD